MPSMYRTFHSRPSAASAADGDRFPRTAFPSSSSRSVPSASESLIRVPAATHDSSTTTATSAGGRDAAAYAAAHSAAAYSSAALGCLFAMVFAAAAMTLLDSLGMVPRASAGNLSVPAAFLGDAESWTATAPEAYSWTEVVRDFRSLLSFVGGAMACNVLWPCDGSAGLADCQTAQASPQAAPVVAAREPVAADASLASPSPRSRLDVMAPGAAQADAADSNPFVFMWPLLCSCLL
eukprot:TRINITY_DN80016_c0_g1_i1.p1 TRINITY_DN80016_c0_g1~~TRINITY_DN80016_c0_g1_i1.p1  ORF type:complete len:236 (+),score=34.58 TRINITY_DN80016_c0_g1_i1:70-777(+)